MTERRRRPPRRPSRPVDGREPGDEADLAARAGLGALARVAAAALRFRPPLYAQAIFGPLPSWFARRRGRSELATISPWRPGRSIGYLSQIAVPSFRRAPPTPLDRLLPAAVRDLFWRPTVVFEHPPGGGHRRCAERWFFVNGLATDRGVAELNADLLVALFSRPVTVIQNSTSSLPLDVWESALGKEFKDDPDLEVRESFTEPCLVATHAILEAINDDGIERVVVLAHSQGTIIVANVLRAVERALEAEKKAGGPDRCRESVERVAAALARRAPRRLAPLCQRFERALVELVASRADDRVGRGETDARDRLRKLEIYTFANCADRMKYVCARGGRPIPWLEHFANERDLVARLGVLSPLRSSPPAIDIDGPLYLRPATRRPAAGGWGHLLNQHYLFSIGDYLAARADAEAGTAPAPAPPYVAGAGDPAEPRLYGYFAGEDPGAFK